MNTRLNSIGDFTCQALRGEPAPWGCLPPGFSIQDVYESCQHHGVSALLYHAMRKRPEWQSWPADLRRMLEEAGRTAIAVELLRSHYLAEITGGFAEAGINFLLLKGEGLARTHYPIPGTRTRSDSDLFIRIADIEAARKLFLDAGYAIVSPVYKTHQFTVRRPGGNADVLQFDIHWRILNSPRFARTISFDEAWNQSAELPGLGGMRTLASAHALLLACMHRVASDWHDQNRLIWIYDIHVLVRAMNDQEMIDFSAEAVRCGIQEACLDGLRNAQRCFATVVGQAVLNILATSTASHSFAYSYLGLFADDWRKLPTWSGRLTILRELFFPTGESLLLKYKKRDRVWLPLLYIRQIFGGLAQRLMLR